MEEVIRDIKNVIVDIDDLLVHTDTIGKIFEAKSSMNLINT
jgi:hypothetical protein